MVLYRNSDSSQIGNHCRLQTKCIDSKFRHLFSPSCLVTHAQIWEKTLPLHFNPRGSFCLVRVKIAPSPHLQSRSCSSLHFLAQRPN